MRVLVKDALGKSIYQRWGGADGDRILIARNVTEVAFYYYSGGRKALREVDHVSQSQSAIKSNEACDTIAYNKRAALEGLMVFD